MERGELTTLFVLGENPAQSEADAHHVRKLLERPRALRRPGHLPHARPRRWRTSSCPRRPAGARRRARSRTASGACSAAARRSTRPARRATTRGSSRTSPRGSARTWHYESPEEIWDELRSLAPNHAGMSYRRLEELGGIQWPCYSEDKLEPTFLHGRLWEEPREGPAAVFHVVEHEPPVDELSEEFPLRLTTGRRLDSFNTGVQTGGYSSPLRRGEELELSTADAAELGVTRRRPRAHHLAQRRGRRAGAGRPRAAARARLHDAALPRRGARRTS